MTLKEWTWECERLFDFAVPSDGLWSLGNGFVIYFVVRETSHGIEDQLTELLTKGRHSVSDCQKSFVHMPSKVVCSPNVESKLVRLSLDSQFASCVIKCRWCARYE